MNVGTRQVKAVDPRAGAGGIGVLAGAALAALLSYFLDPDQGKRRRSVLRDRTAGLLRRAGAATAKQARHVASDAAGTAERLRHLTRERVDYDDVTLARKVETELFRDPSVDKGGMNVNVEHGCVVLRRQVEHPGDIDAIERRVRAIEGVYDVRNLLHLPGTPAPH
ncbi:MAG TPA: BON domain-containing protein [Candidatus Limnocylindria bacterium]|nr:BON domain-containing protein [Candidatus Limnocylindria bacterium]